MTLATVALSNPEVLFWDGVWEDKKEVAATV